ncbi:MarR family winged helix-turn-helix transcriptional regulator [Gryllotalpicola ginsengisoli]|uniref:MarR family winged helix-turn-helix transcriptional regulator n=1 Tax=Gryllotalpicola ginsengisoli TaxID=444608 RepID=UPI0003F6FA22|nr:MarR family transcriptional regulator [Gryllotalpicola ginsengisoli]
MVDSRRSELRELTIALRELAWAVHRRAPDRAGVGPLPTTELALLRQVQETPGATVGELAQQLGLQQSNTSAALRVLERRGYIVRRPHPSDRRAVQIEATEAGIREHEAIAAAWASALDGALASLSEDQLDALLAAVDALDALDNAVRTQPRATTR